MRSMISNRRLMHCLKNEVGSSIVEFAVVSPIMFTMLFAGFDYGHTLYMRSVLQGAVNKAARDSSLETGTAAANQLAVDTKVFDQVHDVNNTLVKDVDVKFSRSYFRTFTNAAAPTSEVFADTNTDGICNNLENYVDENNNSSFDVTGIALGQGNSRDAVKYSATVTYERLFPLAALLGWSDEVELKASTVIANQPYGEVTPPITRKCP